MQEGEKSFLLREAEIWFSFHPEKKSFVNILFFIIVQMTCRGYFIWISSE
jgi:hypothetical protein